ncbi:MAG: XRE family transcriptional regulator [Gemmatimonadales bacterium]|nr:MAG: XRE family transcriptional regulator [Gemmatimonadales bacterium]
MTQYTTGLPRKARITTNGGCEMSERRGEQAVKMGRRLGFYLTLRKMNAPELAEELHVTRNAAYRWVRGESMPSAETLMALAEFDPDLSMDWLLTGSGEMWHREGTAEERLERARILADQMRAVLGTTGPGGGDDLTAQDLDEIADDLPEDPEDDSLPA